MIGFLCLFLCLVGCLLSIIQKLDLYQNILKKGLKDRFIKEGEIVKAKTGHLSGVSNLSGYIFSPKHGPIAFSILMNGYKGSHKKYRNIQDQIVKTIIYD